MNKLKLEALFTSLLIYLIVIVVIFIVTLYSPVTHKAKNYTQKQSNIIEVSLGNPLNKGSQNSKNKVTKSVKKIEKKEKISKKEKKNKKHLKKVRNNKVSKTVNKKNISHKKSKKLSKTKPKSAKVNTEKLFKSLSKDIKEDKNNNNARSGNSGRSLNKVNKSRGEVNRYFANVQNKLKGWPAQSNFAGERVSVELTVYSSGLFSYKILQRSLNPEFNRSLKNYLEQLKRIGFGPHSNPKPYKIIVDFIARG